MKLIKRPLFTVVLSGFLFFNIVTATHGFVTFDQIFNNQGIIRRILLRKIDKPQWVIAYRFGVHCPPEFRHKEKELTALTLEILKGWLEPLHELRPEMAITDDFQFVRQEDFKSLEDDSKNRHLPLKADTRVTFTCESGGPSFALLGQEVPHWPPEVYIRRPGTDINKVFRYELTHELGHVFGLADTYRLPPKRVSTGGVTYTWGMQPSSVMSALAGGDPPYLSEDDWRGIVWLYKHLYEGQPFKDCFFFDYVFEEETGGCRPKHLLIFEVKHGSISTTTLIISDDLTLDVNERDAGGFTALHHAVMRGNADIVKPLLAHKAIKVNILSKDKRTPAQLAREFRQAAIAKLIEAHPSAKLRPWSVSPGGKLTTTWGHLKQQD